MSSWLDSQLRLWKCGSEHWWKQDSNWQFATSVPPLAGMWVLSGLSANVVRCTILKSPSKGYLLSVNGIWICRSEGKMRLMGREVVQLITPGTLIEPLDQLANYLMCIASSPGKTLGLAWIDISTSEFQVLCGHSKLFIYSTVFGVSYLH